MVSGIRTQATPHVARIQNWADRIDLAIAELMPLHAPLGDISGARHHKRAMMVLSTACLGQTGDVIHLTHDARLWGAELILRSVVEGTVKFGYLLESKDVFAERCAEYCDALPTMARRRRHAKAEEALLALSKIGEAGPQAYRDLLLTREELDEIDATYPKDVRIRMEKRWGFGALVDAVSKQTGAFGPTARSLLHGYGSASDLQHMTYEGVEMPLERDQRDPVRREAIELAHAAQLLSSCFHLTWLRVSVVIRLAGRSPDSLFATSKRHSSLLRELDEVETAWEAIEYGQQPSR